MNQNMTDELNPNLTRHEMDPLTIYDSLMYQTAYNNITPVIAPDNVDKLLNHNKLETPNIAMPIEPSNCYGSIPDDIKDEGNSASSNFNTENNDLNNVNYSQNTANSNLPDQSIDNTLNNLNNYQANYNANVNSYQPSIGNAVNQITKLMGKGKCKVKKERSSYWSEKITDKDFPFYGCSVCNICYVDLQDLDKHIATHKDRITSYDLRVKNQLRKKKLKKEKKKLKKLSKKIKQENPAIDIEIKPEDGYIGNETASDFNNKNSGESVNKSGDSKSKEDAKTKQENKDLFNLEKIFKCFACQKQFMLSYYLKLHVRSHTDEKPYTCPKCGQSFITASKLGRHDKRFHLQIKYQCRICYRYFSRFEFLTTHFDKKHADDKIEGEPYDYNAILPYLKELEEELKLKTEQAKAKPKDMWTDDWSGPSFGQVQPEDIMPDAAVKGESEWQDQKVEVPVSTPKNHGSHFMAELEVDVKREYPTPRPEEVLLDEKPPLEVPLEVKIEKPEEPPEDLGVDDAGDDHVKNETDSEEEYFPKNTWLETKLEEQPAPTTAPDKADPLTCKVCSKKISTVSYMKIHMRTHTGEKPYKCYICKAGFITSSKMHRHVLTHPPEEREGKIKKEDGLDSSGDDTDSKPLSAVKEEVKIKKRRRRTKKELAKKVKSETENGETGENGEKGGKKEGRGKARPHACEFCQQRFLHLETLEVHKKSHEGEALKCRYCLSEMEDEASLRTHELTHAGPKPYLCTICGKGYKKKETMIFHRKHHRPDSVFICNLCSKAFNERGKLQRHLMTHRREKYSLKYECPVCAHMFHTKYHVRMHLNTHQKEGLIVEENRNEILAMVLQNARKVPKANAPDVPESIPSDERSRVCNICGEVFTHFYYLEEHLKNHGSKLALEDEEEPEIKKHVCQVCNKSFKLHYYLKLHSFTHTKEKPYICQECGKGFITRGKLKRHLETHAGLKKYQCHVCYKFFTRPSYLRVHVRTIHGTQDYNFRLAQNLGHAYSRDE